ISVSSAGAAKVLTISPAKGGKALAPNDSTIRNQTYAITRRLYLYTHGAPNEKTKEFLDYVRGPAGQALVANNGFVNTDLAKIAGRVTPGSTATGAVYDTAIRFQSNSFAIDSLGISDLEKIEADLGPQSMAEVNVVGHADSIGNAEKNMLLSMQRAST